VPSPEVKSRKIKKKSRGGCIDEHFYLLAKDIPHMVLLNTRRERKSMKHENEPTYIRIYICKRCKKTGGTMIKDEVGGGYFHEQPCLPPNEIDKLLRSAIPIGAENG
jgi:hypothetical protein